MDVGTFCFLTNGVELVVFYGIHCIVEYGLLSARWEFCSKPRREPFPCRFLARHFEISCQLTPPLR